MVNQSGGQMEDRGWQQMNALLDKEMPVEGKKRFFWWPIVGAAAMVLILSTVYRVQQTMTEQESSTDLMGAETREIERGGAERANAANSGASPMTGESDKFESNLTSKGEENSKQLTDRVEEIFKEKPDRASLQKLQFVAEAKTAMDQNGNVFPDEAFQPTPDPEESSADHRDAEINSASENAMRPIFLELETLEGIAFGVNYRWDIEPFIGASSILEAESPILVEKRKNWSVAPVASLLAESKGHRWGADLGIQGDFAFGDILAIESGISLFVLNPNQIYSRQRNVDLQWSSDNRFGQALDNSSNPDQVLADQMTVAYVTGARYLRIPLQVRFHPSRKIQPYAGVDRLLLLRSGKDEDVVELNQAPGIVSSNQQERIELRASNWAWKAGLVFEVRDHLFFDFSYSHGSKSYLDAEVDKGAHFEIHRYFRLGMGYRMGRK